MFFNSYPFIFLFLPVVLGGYFVLGSMGQRRAAVWWTSLLSLALYAAWDGALVLLCLSIAFNYAVGMLILRSSSRAVARPLAFFGIAANLLLLGYYKYIVFVLGALHIHGLNLNPALPLGISFFTFTQIAFLADCCRRHKEDYRYRFGDYLFFVTFFPHLVAGPILNHQRVIPQLEGRKFALPHSPGLGIGLTFFFLGLFKKLLIADMLAPYADALFTHAHQLSFLEAWTAALFYTFQLYFDFSGYSEMAYGIARMMNIRIPLNFLSPYKSRSIIEFWHRWHRSLSFFLRDYVYIPLGGNRSGEGRKLANLFLTTLLGGIWHGAGWTFIVWGALHGGYLVINHSWRRLGLSLPRTVGRTLTFLAVVGAWVVFRAGSLGDARAMLSRMAGLHGLTFSHETLGNPAGAIAALAFLLIWVLLLPNVREIAVTRHPRRAVALGVAVAGFIAVLHLSSITSFLYYRF